jgi:DNA-binding response OmpR family regulator
MTAMASRESRNMPNRIVLVVDDDAIIADTLAIILNQSGFKATAVHSGEEAVQIAEDLKPVYLISDVHMCGMNGIETALRICEKLPGCRVLLFSGDPDAEAMLPGPRTSGPAFEFLNKPFHPKALLSRMGSTMGVRAV